MTIMGKNLNILYFINEMLIAFMLII